MSDQKPPSRLGKLRQYVGLGLLAGTFAVSVGFSVHSTLTVEHPNKTVIRLAHFQLEHGYRDALEAVIRDYEALHPDVHVEQDPLPERVYAQSINTQLVSDTAPDLVEIKTTDVIANDENTVRYFTPLSTIIVKPNPYNAGTDLAGQAWKDTLLDGMQAGFREGLADYYAVASTLNSMRLFYNKTLLKAATGTDAPPATFGEWMRTCEKVRAYAAAHDGRILPIVSCYDTSSIQHKYETAFTASLENVVDTDLDGDTSAQESYAAFCRGDVSPRTPQVQAVYRTVRAITGQMQQGFSAMDRQQAQYRFVNGLAAFMWSGSWDAEGTAVQAKEKGIEIGVMRLPMPGPGEPDAAFMNGPAAETAGGGGVYGVTKSSPHADVAIDFLMFLTSQRENEKMNRLAQWPPVTIGARPSELMQPFTADPRGQTARLQLMYGTRVTQDVTNAALDYFQGDTTLDTFTANFERSLRDPNRGGDWAWWNDFHTAQADVRRKERVLAQQQALQLLDPQQADVDKYRRSLLQQVLRNDGLGQRYHFQAVRGRPMPEF